MPRRKDLKRLVRGRMKKTGEAYTAALSHINSKQETATAATDAAPIDPDAGSNAIDHAAVAGMSDEKLKAKTGRTWERWVHALDGHRADQMPHGEIAALVNEKYGIDGWWSQTVTVGYERIRGLRARGQRRDGTYEVNKSRTYDVPVATLYDAWSDEDVRRQWIDADVKVRTATPPKSMRLGWADGSIIAVGFTAKGASRSSVSLGHTKLPDRETAERLRQYWSDRLDTLGEVLTQARTAGPGT